MQIDNYERRLDLTEATSSWKQNLGHENFELKCLA